MIDMVQFLTIIGAILGSCFWFSRETRAEIESIRNDAKAQAARTDQLYRMFCDLRKDLSDIMKEGDQKFYDLLKEQKGKT